MNMKTRVGLILDFLACLAKVEAMRGANDCRHRMGGPPMYASEEFKNCVKYIQGVEQAIADKNVAGFMAKVLKAKGEQN